MIVIIALVVSIVSAAISLFCIVLIWDSVKDLEEIYQMIDRLDELKEDKEADHD